MNKSEEWETRKKKEITTTRQIETRVKRQVVLEDGEVIVDSGPQVTTNTTEDVEQQEHTTQERRTIGDDPSQAGTKSGKCTLRINNFDALGNPDDSNLVQEELNETVVRSHEETEETLETEDRQQLGDISDEAYQKAVHSNRGDLRVALAESTKQLLASAQSGPRVVQHTTRSSKVVDTEKTLERKQLKANGLIVTERKRTVEHEELKDDPAPEDGSGSEGNDNEPSQEKRKECSQRFMKKRDEDLVDYISGGERIAREMRYVAETTEGERIGDWPPSATSSTNAAAMRKTRSRTNNARKDALTKEPLDLEEEDEARKFETSKWLENHFGTEFKSSYKTVDAAGTVAHLPNTSNTSYINVTMKSCCPPKERDYQNVQSSRQNKHHQQRVSKKKSALITEYSTPPTSPPSSSEYFHGISEWSERHNHHRENQNPSSRYKESSSNIERVRINGKSEEKPNNSYENIHQNGYRDNEQQRTPSPPVRRKYKNKKITSRSSHNEQLTNERETIARSPSPVNVIQRTWESRSRDLNDNNKTIKPLSTSSKSILKEERNQNVFDEVDSRPPKSQSKYRINESIRKLVGKLRPSSLERKNKQQNKNSVSQLTQTDDNEPTYLQYNVVDRNVPLVSDRRIIDENLSANSNNTSKTTITSTKEWVVPNYRYSDTSRHRGKSQGIINNTPPTNTMFTTMESNSLGRFSKSTGRLTNNETLPIRNTNPEHEQDVQMFQRHYQKSRGARSIPIRQENVVQSPNQDRHYNSMINISIKNTVTSLPLRNNIQNSTFQVEEEESSERKSTLSRSKSFNLEADKNQLNVSTFTTNSQLNRVVNAEPSPLKSPGILASISRSNRDLFKENKREY